MARFAMLAALVALALLLWLRLAQPAAPVPAPQRTARYNGTVLGDVRAQHEGSSFLFALDAGPTVLVSAAGVPPRIAQHLRLRGRLLPFDGPRNPLEPSLRAIQAERGITARIASAQILAHLPAASLRDPRVLGARLHAWAYAQLRAHLPPVDAALLAGELWGERSDLPPELRAEFQTTGTVHVLVTAGLHVGVMAALALALFGVLGLPRAWACALGALLVWSYVAFSGAHLPSVRAATMLSFALAARACGRNALSWNALAAAAIVLVLARPSSIASASFALSFSCVGAIFALLPLLEPMLEHRLPRVPHRLREAFALTLATQLGTWPLSAAIFLQFSSYALLANLAVVPLVGTTMLLGGAQLLLSPLPLFAQLAANVNAWLLAWMLAAVHLLAMLPGARLPMTPAPAWCIAAYDLALLGGTWLWSRGTRSLALALLLCTSALVLAPPRTQNTTLRVTALDVGQGDGFVVQSPRGHVLLIDAGTPAMGRLVVLPFLLRHGIHAVDAIMSSHPHAGHAGGAIAVLQSLRVGALIDAGVSPPNATYEAVLAAAAAAHVPILHVRTGAIWRSDDGLSLRSLAPTRPWVAGTPRDMDENSLILRLRYGCFTMLFTGDAGDVQEARLLAAGAPLRAQVLKVGHHGSAYASSPAFLAAVQPRIAVISVGRYNRFGLPTARALAALRRAGARILRTDHDGAVSLAVSGRRDARTHRCAIGIGLGDRTVRPNA
ncbi:MAG: DNA internalization-related competence protein ComEC/Rec2 [Vulcanimicrobiaceae bacterium]